MQDADISIEYMVVSLAIRGAPPLFRIWQAEAPHHFFMNREQNMMQDTL